MNLTGDLPAAVQQFSAQLPSLLKSLTDAGLTTEAQLVQGLHATVSDAISQEQDAIAIDLKPVVDQIAAFNANVATFIGLIQSIKDDGIPLSATLGGKQK